MGRFGLTILLGVAVLAALILLSVLYGATRIPVSEVTAAAARVFCLSDADPTPTSRIILDLRLPRALFSAIIGAGLGLVGVVLQTTTRNDLADPFLFGLSSGAAAGAVFVITVTGDILGIWTLPVAAFCGGIIASGVVLALVHSLRSSAPEKLILAGLAVSFLFAAITNYLIFAGDNRAAHSIVFWMLGGLGLSRWSTFPLVLFGLLLIFAFAFYRRRWLDALLAGDMTAKSLGVPVHRLRMMMFLVAALSTAAFVAVAGVIGFVGLMVPHLARGLAGPLHTRAAANRRADWRDAADRLGHPGPPHPAATGIARGHRDNLDRCDLCLHAVDWKQPGQPPIGLDPLSGYRDVTPDKVPPADQDLPAVRLVCLLAHCIPKAAPTNSMIGQMITFSVSTGSAAAAFQATRHRKTARHTAISRLKVFFSMYSPGAPSMTTDYSGDPLQVRYRSVRIARIATGTLRIVKAIRFPIYQ